MNMKDKEPTMLPTIRIAVTETGDRVYPNWQPCEIGREIKFDSAGLESYCFANWEPIIFDAILLAAAVDFCDRIVRRPRLGWGREFYVRIPVHEPDRWSGWVTDQLVAALALLTGDRWHIAFRPRKSPQCELRQENFEIPDPSSAVLPFSEGLDSRIASALIEHQSGRKLIRVRLGANKEQRTKNAQLKQPFVAVPYTIKIAGRRFPEPSARSRGFKFMLLSGVAAYLSKTSEVLVTESGQGALGPALVPVGHAYEDYRNHPRFAAKMAEFLSVLFDHPVRFSFPRIWYTKGETLKEYSELLGGPWADTRSCWQQSGQVSVNGHRRQCGICAACMLRRLSVHSAGLTESPDTYVWESLNTNYFEDGAAAGFVSITKALREYAIAGTLHLDHLAAVIDSPLHAESIGRTVFQIASPLGLTVQETEERLCRMLRRHTLEWRNFIASLGENSFVAKWIPRRENDEHLQPRTR